MTLRSSYRAVRGFTLLELLVVVLIIGLLTGIVGPRLMGQIGRSEVTAAKAQIDSLDKAVQAYQAGRTAAAQGGDVEGARNDMRNAIQQIAAQADSYRSGTDSIANEFWRGFEDGFDG